MSIVKTLEDISEAIVHLSRDMSRMAIAVGYDNTPKKTVLQKNNRVRSISRESRKSKNIKKKSKIKKKTTRKKYSKRK